MNGFSYDRRSARIIATLGGMEAELLRSLAAQVVELLAHEQPSPHLIDPLEALLDFSGPTTAPDDPVLARLFPTAYADDDEAAAEFRRYTEGGLRDGKAQAAGAIIDDLTDAGLGDGFPDPELMFDVELSLPRALMWLRSFTDIRLALATRLGVEADDEHRWAALPDDDPQGQAHDIYLWMGFLQESLVEALDGAGA